MPFTWSLGIGSALMMDVPGALGSDPARGSVWLFGAVGTAGMAGVGGESTKVMMLGLDPALPVRALTREILPLGRVRFLAVPVDLTVPLDVALLTVPERDTGRSVVGFGVMERVDVGVARPLLFGAAGISPLATGRVELRLMPPLLPPADQVFAPPAALLTLTKLPGSSSLLESAGRSRRGRAGWYDDDRLMFVSVRVRQVFCLGEPLDEPYGGESRPESSGRGGPWKKPMTLRKKPRFFVLTCPLFPLRTLDPSDAAR